MDETQIINGFFKEKKASKLYFPNLDGLRGLAVFLVVAWHIEIHKVRFGFKQLFFNDIGFIGVSIFFVLSGFLITYILIVEKDINQKVNFKAFYMRRVLRIWPLYFFTLLFGFFIYPRGMSLSTLSMCVFFMPNIPFMMGLIHPFVQPIWSIGVEEQFYLFQPQFFRIENKKVMLIAITALTVFLMLLQQIAFKLPNNPFFSKLANYLYFFRIDQLLIGSIGALILYYHKNNKGVKNTLTSILFNKYVQVVAWIYFAGHIFSFSFFHGIFVNSKVFVFVVVTIVINLCIPETSIILLNKSYMRYIGKVSYGIYLLHNFVLISVLYIMKQNVSTLNPLATNMIIYGLTFPLTILVAGLSYEYFESYFLKLKVKYSTVHKQEL